MIVELTKREGELLKASLHQASRILGEQFDSIPFGEKETHAHSFLGLVHEFDVIEAKLDGAIAGASVEPEKAEQQKKGERKMKKETHVTEDGQIYDVELCEGCECCEREMKHDIKGEEKC